MEGKFFKEGSAAYGAGIAKDNCPYPAGSDEQEAWQEGWDEALGCDADEGVIDNF